MQPPISWEIAWGWRWVWWDCAIGAPGLPAATLSEVRGAGQVTAPARPARWPLVLISATLLTLLALAVWGLAQTAFGRMNYYCLLRDYGGARRRPSWSMPWATRTSKCGGLRPTPSASSALRRSPPCLRRSTIRAARSTTRRDELLAEIRPNGVDELVRQVRGPDPKLRGAAMGQLKSLGAKAAPAVDALVGVLADADASSRAEAAATLLAVGPEAGGARRGAGQGAGRSRRGGPPQRGQRAGRHRPQGGAGHRGPGPLRATSPSVRPGPWSGSGRARRRRRQCWSACCTTRKPRSASRRPRHWGRSGRPTGRPPCAVGRRARSPRRRSRWRRWPRCAARARDTPSSPTRWPIPRRPGWSATSSIQATRPMSPCWATSSGTASPPCLPRAVDTLGNFGADAVPLLIEGLADGEGEVWQSAVSRPGPRGPTRGRAVAGPAGRRTARVCGRVPHWPWQVRAPRRPRRCRRCVSASRIPTPSLDLYAAEALWKIGRDAAGVPALAGFLQIPTTTSAATRRGRWRRWARRRDPRSRASARPWATRMPKSA